MATSSIVTFAAIYVLGVLTGFSFLLFLIYFYTSAQHEKAACKEVPTKEEDRELHIDESKTSALLNASRDGDVAAGYFAVCREYVPGGVSATPSSRKIAGQESASVYQNLYRNMLKKSETFQEPGTPIKRAANVFFVVMRHGHLMLFDNAEQIEVRQVIPLASFDICVRGDDNVIPEGELWIKRNCICLHRRSIQSKEKDGRSSYFLFSNNCSEKEDFYHALLLNQYKSSEDRSHQPQAQPFDTEHMIKLIRQLHASEDNVQTRWLNALTGRIFLALYKTSQVEELVKAKIRKKISRVAKPTFISSLSLKEIELGDSAPTFVRLRLKEMGVDGALTLETDAKYTGQFKAVIAATARIDLGQRFKPREVDLVLAGVLKKLEGHLLIHIKPPPSNRVWMSFETMPKIQLSLEPIVSSRQITFGYILTAIERRIMEVINDTIVFPNWDDIAFLDTSEKDYRGGIWTESSKSHVPTSEASLSDVAEDIRSSSTGIPKATARVVTNEPGSAMYHADTVSNEDLYSSASFDTEQAESAVPTSSALNGIPVASISHDRVQSDLHDDAHSTVQSFAKVVQESTETHDASAEKFSSPIKPLTRDEKSESLFASPTTGHTETRKVEGGNEMHAQYTNESPITDQSSHERDKEQSLPDVQASSTDAHADRANAEGTPPPLPLNKRILTATTAARNWGTTFLQRQHDGLMRHDDSERPQEPMGRGSPLPPPGQPLPGPSPKVWTTPALKSIKRKSISTSSPSHAESSGTGK